MIAEYRWKRKVISQYIRKRIIFTGITGTNMRPHKFTSFHVILKLGSQSASCASSSNNLNVWMFLFKNIFSLRYCKTQFSTSINLPWVVLPQKMWALSLQPFWRFLDTNKQTDNQGIYIDVHCTVEYFHCTEFIVSIIPYLGREWQYRVYFHHTGYPKVIINYYFVSLWMVEC